MAAYQATKTLAIHPLRNRAGAHSALTTEDRYDHQPHTARPLAHARLPNPPYPRAIAQPR